MPQTTETNCAHCGKSIEKPCYLSNDDEYICVDCHAEECHWLALEESQPCDTCNGRGRTMEGWPCEDCDGSGHDF